MREPITIKLDEVTLAAAKARAEADNRSLASYLENIIRVHVAAVPVPEVSVFVADGITDFKSDRLPDDTDEGYARRAALSKALFKLARK